MVDCGACLLLCAHHLCDLDLRMEWFWISFIYKTMLDAIAAFIQITYGVQNLTILGTWAVELMLLPFGIAGVWGLGAFRHRWPRGNIPPPTRDEIVPILSDPAA